VVFFASENLMFRQLPLDRKNPPFTYHLGTGGSVPERCYYISETFPATLFSSSTLSPLPPLALQPRPLNPVLSAVRFLKMWLLANTGIPGYTIVLNPVFPTELV